MKKLIIFLVFFMSAHLMIGQTEVDNSSLSKKEKRKARIEKEYQHTKDMLYNKSFVLEADALQDKYGRRIQVSSGINFVSVDSTEAIIQVGSYHHIGYNGVGGITARGQINKWEVTENVKNKTFDVYMNVMTTIGIYDVYFSISSSGNATAHLTGLSAGRLTFDGQVVPWDQSTIYVGRSV